MSEWEEELYRYRLQPAPEKLPLQEYIERFLETGDDTHFAHFLHYYESVLNDLAKGAVQDYAMQGHFSDVKSACVYGLLSALQRYEKDKGPFVPYAGYEMKRAVDDYVRTMRTGFTVPTDTEYYLLRKVMHLWAEHDYRMDAETLAAIGGKIRRKPKRVREMILGGLRNMQFMDFYHMYSDEDGEEGSEDVTVDHSSDPCTMFLWDEQAAELYAAFQALDYRERDMLSRHYAFCPTCFATKDKDGIPLEKWTYMDLMLQYGYSSPDTVEKACKKALKKMRKRMGGDPSPGRSEDCPYQQKPQNSACF